MLKFIAAYLGAGATFALLDAVWLTQVGPRLYRPALDPVLADTVAPAPAVAFYLVYLLGVVVLAVLPATRGGGWVQALVAGAVLGLVAYGAYDLTNHATLKVWSWRITLADMAWGTTLTGLAATAGWFAHRAAQRAFG